MNNPLLARYAECIFWLARFVERSENLARILEVNETYGRDRSGAQNWLSIVELNADEAVFAAKHARATADSVIRFYVTDAENPDLDRLRDRQCARERPHAASAGLDRDVGDAECVPQSLEGHRGGGADSGESQPIC